MSYDIDKIINEIKSEVKRACYAPENKFADSVWDYHILPVVRHSLRLGKILQADLEVLELAALLHDYAGLVNYSNYAKHHEHGARLAEDILNKYKYPKDKIKLIKACILNHRASVVNNKKSLEEKIIASADAMSHITELADMFYLTYGVHKRKTREGAKWLKDKLERGWDKIIPEGRELIQEDYKIALKLLNKAIK